MESTVAHAREGGVLRLDRQGLDDLSELHGLRDRVQHTREKRLARRPERSWVCGEPCQANLSGQS